MPNLTLSGVVLGLKSNPYDFEDAESGQRKVGTSHKLYLWDDANSEPCAVSVPENLLPQAQALGAGEVIAVQVALFARNSRVSFSVARFLEAA